jgi:hypothetical protein
MVVLQRKLDVMQMMMKEDHDPLIKTENFRGLSSLDLALDWPTGLKLLCSYASSSSEKVEKSALEFQRAFNAACKLGNEEAIKIMLAAKRTIFAPIVGPATDSKMTSALWTLVCAIEAADKAAESFMRGEIEPQRWQSYLSITKLVINSL